MTACADGRASLTGMRARAGLVALMWLAACGDGGGQRIAVTQTPTAPLASATVTRAATPTVEAPSPSPTSSPPTVTATSPEPTATQVPTASATPTVSPTSTASLTPSATPSSTLTAGADGAVAPLSDAGRWFVDGLGRVVLLHGVNMVAKSPVSAATMPPSWRRKASRLCVWASTFAASCRRRE
jgi:hypothetical protein